jgi:hypothetical protein
MPVEASIPEAPLGPNENVTGLESARLRSGVRFRRLDEYGQRAG